MRSAPVKPPKTTSEPSTKPPQTSGFPTPVFKNYSTNPRVQRAFRTLVNLKKQEAAEREAQKEAIKSRQTDYDSLPLTSEDLNDLWADSELSSQLMSQIQQMPDYDPNWTPAQIDAAGIRVARSVLLKFRLKSLDDTAAPNGVCGHLLGDSR